jgi:hypothetical protein
MWLLKVMGRYGKLESEVIQQGFLVKFHLKKVAVYRG